MNRFAPEEHGDSIAALRSALGRSDLVLYLGAGVSIASGAPSWDELLRRLTYRMIAEEAGELREETDPMEMRELFRHFRRRSPLILARYLRHYFGPRFREEVREALYQSLEEDRHSRLIEEIGRLAAASGRDSGLYGIVTYNFDDLLEQALRRHGVAYRVIVGPGSRYEAHTLPIYHVQGYLPRREDPDTTFGIPHDLIFSEETYHSQYLNPYSWTNLTQLHLLREHTGLFVGLSMTDPNLRRLLDVVHEQEPERLHYALIPTLRAEAKDLPGSNQETLEAMDESRLAQALRELEERVARSLGLELLWIDHFDRIPALLATLR